MKLRCYEFLNLIKAKFCPNNFHIWTGLNRNFDGHAPSRIVPHLQSKNFHHQLFFIHDELPHFSVPSKSYWMHFICCLDHKSQADMISFISFLEISFWQWSWTKCFFLCRPPSRWLSRTALPPWVLEVQKKKAISVATVDMHKVKSQLWMSQRWCAQSLNSYHLSCDYMCYTGSDAIYMWCVQEVVPYTHFFLHRKLLYIDHVLYRKSGLIHLQFWIGSRAA